MAKQDYYAILGVDKGADEAALKKAFRKKAMECHPDRNPGDKDAEKKFKELNEAFDILKDPQKRAAYDQFGHAAFEGGMGPGGQGGGGFRPGGFEFNFGGGGGGFSDIFEEMFGEFTGRGRRQQRQQQARGQDQRFNMEITLEEAFSGKQATIRVPGTAACEACKGSGADGGAKPEACGTCSGRGRVRASQGFFTVERTCPTCQGTGEVISNPCKSCGGDGRTRKDKTLQVNVPAGVDDGTRIRLTGEGEAGLRSAPAGDLYIFVSVAPHDIFQRDGADIFCSVPLPMTTAALGGSVEVPTIDGKRARVTVPAGTQTGEHFRLRGKGMSVLRSTARGDMFIEIDVETPQGLSKKQKALLQEFAKEGGPDGLSASPRAKSFFDRVKGMFAAAKE